ncbi:ArnT family glycosyltransferase [Terriglobus tenax]|uniref:ArnT family glycosyltransferase n=1 Tax=Terriglobus tenax TaxID=1111115 RepID=UPI0021E06D07|nr:glycosyltransferase family 39 protein [Terriglobus tenax]
MSIPTSFAVAEPAAPFAAARRKSVAILVAIWAILQLGGIFTPGLLDDVDSVYLEVAREMLVRHDYVTPYVDGIRFFDKPPLMYWLAAGSMKIFGPHDWAGRLPLALLVLGLTLSVYALGKRLFGERGGFYSGLAIATSIGTYLFTRFYIPDVPLALWMTVSIHLLLIALDRVRAQQSALKPMLGFATITALNVLTKGLIGLVFPVGFALIFLLLTGQLAALRRLHLLASTALFLLITLPWHVLAALRNPAINTDARGWFWFYVINEHFMRFVGKRIPHDYGQVPVLIFWGMILAWLLPWAVFLPRAVRWSVTTLRSAGLKARESEAPLALFLWAIIVIGFFSLGSRQEYYALPALPALALLAGGQLARAEEPGHPGARKAAYFWTVWLLLPITTLAAVVCTWFAITAPIPPAGTDISALLTTNPDRYTLALGHLYDLTGQAMGFFHFPLILVAVSMYAAGLTAWLLRRAGRFYAANVTLAVAMMGNLWGMHEGLARFYPILGSKGLADAITAEFQPGDQIMLDGELTSGSSIAFYTRQPLHLINGRVNGPWYGSFWPDAADIFEDNNSLYEAWAGKERVFLMTYEPKKRTADLTPFGGVYVLKSEGGKTVLTNHP